MPALPGCHCSGHPSPIAVLPAIIYALTSAVQRFFFHSLWIYTMNRCTLAPIGRALLCLDFFTPVEAA